MFWSTIIAIVAATASVACFVVGILASGADEFGAIIANSNRAPPMSPLIGWGVACLIVAAGAAVWRFTA